MPDKVICWQYRDCKSTSCPAHGKQGIICWTTDNVECLKGLEPAEAIRTCSKCEVFKTNTNPETSGGFLSLFNQLYKELEKSESHLLLLRKVSSLVQSSIELDSTLHIILTCVTAGYGLGFNRALLLLINSETGLLEGVMGVAPASAEEAAQIWNEISSFEIQNDNVESIVDIYEKKFTSRDSDIDLLAKKITIDLAEDNIFSYCVKSKKSVVCTNQSREKIPAVFLDVWRTDYFAIAPLIAKGRVSGVIVADNFFNFKPITPEFLELLAMFAFHAGLAVENARLYERIEKRAKELEETNERLRETQDILMRTEKLSAIGKWRQLLPMK